MMRPLCIHLNEVSVSYKAADGSRITTLKGVNLNAQRGERIAIMGPSGSGKSTLLKVIANLINKTSSEVDLEGVVVVGDPAGKDPTGEYPTIGYMAQESKDVVVPWKKVGRLLQDAPLLSALELQDQVKNWPAKLSGGQLRRLALGYIVSSDRDIFLLDEPLTGLDINIREKVTKVIKEKVEDKDILLFVTHYIEEAELLANRALYIDKGSCTLYEDMKYLRERVERRSASETV